MLGKEALSSSNAGLAASSTCGSSRSVARRSSWRLASAPVVVLKLVIRSLRLPSLRTSAAATFWLPLTSRARSPGLVPRKASFTMADWRSASGAYSSESFSDSAAVWPWVSGSWVASSAAVGLPLIASP